MEQQEYIIQLSMIQQEAQKLEERIHIIDEQMLDMQSIRKSLDDIDSKGEGDEILSNLGKGIFMKTNIKEKNLLVNVGKNIVVEKSLEDTKKVLDTQIQQLMAGKEEVMAKMQELQNNMIQLVKQAEAEQSSSKGGKKRVKNDKKK